MWQRSLLLPGKEEEWTWAGESLVGLPALVRVLVALKRAGVEQVLIPSVSETVPLRSLVESFKAVKDLPDVVWWEQAGEIRFSEDDSILVIRGGVLFTPRMVEWFHEALLGEGKGKAQFEGANRLPVLISLPSEMAYTVKEPSVRFEEVSSQVRVYTLSIPQEMFCGQVLTLGKPGKDRGLLGMVGKPTDRPHVVWVRRRTFPAIRWLARFGITPNQVTWAGFGIALLACFLIAKGDYLSGILGAMLLYLSWVVDCMDGTLARLTFSESLFGQKLDTVLGHLTNLFTFGALIWAVWGNEPLWKAGVFAFFILGGIVAVYYIIEEEKKYSRVPREKPEHGKLRLFLDKVNHRDYAVVVFLFALLNGFKIFLWLSLVGIQVFWLLRFLILHKERQRAEA